MAKLTKDAQAERDEAIGKLREWIRPGDTVYTILDHVSNSGMSRIIRVVLLKCEQHSQFPADSTVTDLHPNYLIGKALGYSHGRRRGKETDGLRVDGCGMDMGYHLIDSLSSALGYRVRHRWL